MVRRGRMKADSLREKAFDGLHARSFKDRLEQKRGRCGLCEWEERDVMSKGWQIWSVVKNCNIISGPFNSAAFNIKHTIHLSLARPDCDSHIYWHTALIQFQPGHSYVFTYTSEGAGGINPYEYRAVGLKRLCWFSPVTPANTPPPTHIHANIEKHLPLASPLTILRGRKVRATGVSLTPTINHILARQYIQLSKLPNRQGEYEEGI